MGDSLLELALRVEWGGVKPSGRCARTHYGHVAVWDIIPEWVDIQTPYILRYRKPLSMQTNCFCLNWAITEKYPDAENLAAFLMEEESDDYKRDVPNRIWLSDSTIEYHDVSEALADLSRHVPPELTSRVATISSCISFPVSIDELGLGTLPDSCFFASLSPGRVEKVLEAFRSVDFAELATLQERRRAKRAKGRSDPDRFFVSYLEQWRDTLAFAAGIKYGLIGGRG